MLTVFIHAPTVRMVPSNRSYGIASVCHRDMRLLARCVLSMYSEFAVPKKWVYRVLEKLS
jgi:hypothetical protein